MVEMDPYTAVGQATNQAPRRPTHAAGQRRDADRRTILARTVQLDVIPRLLLTRFPAAAATEIIGAGEITELARITIGANETSTRRFVTGARDRGVTAESVYLDLLAPAARRLGEWWEDDICDFAEVTIGLLRLQGAMREISPSFLGAADLGIGGRPSGPRALLVPLPGEQHTFGLSMVHDFFRRAGWDAWSGPVASRAELAAMVQHQWIDVVGFSMGCDERMEVARAEIRAVRQASRNPGMAVMVGGPPFIANPRLAAEIGADGTARDGLQAVGEAAALLRRADQRR